MALEVADLMRFTVFNPELIETLEVEQAVQYVCPGLWWSVFSVQL